MAFKNITVEKIGKVARITLNRPDKLNAVDDEMLTEVEQSLAEIQADPAVKVVILTAKGRAFSAGADLKFVKSLMGSTEQLMSFFRHFQKVIIAIENLDKPVVCAVNGMALAGGLELVMGCDIVIAAESARLGDQHANFGLVAGGGGTQRLPRLIGIRRAKELLLTGNWLSAGEAREFGLVNKVVPDNKLEEAALEMTNNLAAKSSTASALVKRLVNEGMQLDLKTGLELETWAAANNNVNSADAKAGMKAFAEGKKPVFD